MAIGMVWALGRGVAVGRVGSTGCAEGSSWVCPGLGINMEAQLDGAGVAGAEQLEMMRV